ncbi:MAG: arginine--tRNA ligase [Candidatus Zambryskibacteria bacterium RIFOXYC1_FULL_39_10]|uniref:Arginine--tRNA ligase n=1 Tax=Candidatus Zambryskibacteria bacterium RIFOXYC1_FULL_39_10 TaxID=1802779 RepID=A0A1G2V419_9BACT|nr:MAG: arginine--tRNA ligase [Candidatus Zambryskibacteria bacterium RIFOXYD1_FULL_39_35]OHB16377.1 MAG: arginine--tRNA ligase [Candidatus Zambryskibacteria bacterium RIFOXYC1_FULL_39_10]
MVLVVLENKMNIQEKIKKWIKETLKLGGDFVLAHPKDIKNGDFSFFSINENSKDLADRLEKNKILEIEKIEVVGKFINFYLSKEFFAKSVEEILNKGEKCGESKLFENKKIIIEHTQPNPFKVFHIGHLMNNAIGESITRIIKANGAETKAVGYHGDVGLHVAKAVYGLDKELSKHKVYEEIKNKVESKKEQVELMVFTEDDQLRKYINNAYAYGYKMYEEDEIDRENILKINKEIYENNNSWISYLYKSARQFSIDNFEYIYKLLSSHFDDHFYESETGEIGKKIVLENVGKIFENGEGGAVIFRGENFEPKTHTRVFINSEGITTYEAKEVGLAKLKKEKYDYNQSITITANEQDAFFGVTEVAIGEVIPGLKGKLKHLSHGMLRLPSGKMSSRTGDVISAEFLIDFIKAKVQEKIKALKHLSLRVKMTAEEEEKMTEIVAIGAIKYSILRQAIGGDIIFDFDKSISFEGDSGPYLQYACVRANSVLEKAKSEILNSKSETNSKSKIQIPETWEITELERHLYKFEETVERAGIEYAPHHIVTYLTELASIFNSFYASNKIIDEDDPTSPYKIALTQAVALTLKSGLNLLGIKVPERM